MDVILLERIESLGQMGDLVKVKTGYARNYLLPQGKALRATTDNVKRFEQEKAQLEAVNLERRSEAEAVAAKAGDVSVVLVRQAGEAGQLYGSVGARDIGDAVSEAGVSVDRRQVKLDRPIKAIGLHKVRVDLHPEVTIEVTVNVARSSEEAEVQSRLGRALIHRDEPEEDEDDQEAAAEVPEAIATDDDSSDAPAPSEIFEDAELAEESSEVDDPERPAG